MTDDADADLEKAEPSALVRLAAVAQALTGLLVGLCGLQLVGSLLGWPRFVPWVQLALGPLQLYLGAMVFRARPWAAFAGAGLGGVAALLMVGWLVFLASRAAFSCMVFVTAPLSVLSALLAVAAIGGVSQTAEARRRLADQGMNLGL